MSIELAAPTLAWLLVTARLWALLRVAPAWRVAVGPWWNVLSAGLAGVLAVVAVGVQPAGVVPTPEPSGLIAIAALLVGELLVGTLLGLVASLPAYALLGAAASTALVLRIGPKPVVALTVALVLAAGLSLGMHRPLIAAALDTLAMVPLGDPLAAPVLADDGAVRGLARAAHTMLLLALSLWTPALLAGVAFEVAARLLGRGGGPATAAADVAPWLRLGAAMVALGASWSAYVPAWTTALLPP